MLNVDLIKKPFRLLKNFKQKRKIPTLPGQHVLYGIFVCRMYLIKNQIKKQNGTFSDPN